MLKRNKILILIISELVFLLFLIVILPSVFIRERPGIRQTSFEDTLPIDINHTYFQSFNSDQDNLNSVSVLLKNPGLESYDAVYLEVLDNKQKIVRELSISGRGIQDPGWLNFKFPALISKKGDTFFIKVSGNSQRDNLLYVYGNYENKNINFKTTYTTLSLKDSVTKTIENQKTKIQQRNFYQSVTYSLLIFLVNILIFTLI